MPDRPHARPTARRTCRFAKAAGPRRAALPVAESRASRNNIDVKLIRPPCAHTSTRPQPEQV